LLILLSLLIGFGIKKLQINMVIEDEKVGLDDLQQEIEEFEDYVQSTDVVSFYPYFMKFLSYCKSLTNSSGCHAKIVDACLDFSSSIFLLPYRFLFHFSSLISTKAFFVSVYL